MLTVPNFLSTDVNPTSSSFGEQVSPHQFEGQVTGWYFGQST